MAISAYPLLQTSRGFSSYNAWHIALLLFGLCLIAYSPTFNNGFISDDFIMLDWVEQWEEDFLFFFRMVPDVFRITGYAAFRILKGVFGYRPEFFYAFSILVHVLNAVLLWKLLERLSGSRRVAVLAAVLFAVFQNPQEAIKWMAALADALAGFCVLAALLFWLKEKFLWSSLFYLAGLFSKESAVVVILLIPLLEFSARRKLTLRNEHLYLLMPLLLFLVVFAVTTSSNYMLADGYYAFGPRGLLVLGITLHRLMFPWLYVAILCYLVTQRRQLPGELASGLIWMTIGLSPFIFLTYQNHIPSRHQYIGSMGLVWAVAVLLEQLDRKRLRQALIAAFILINIGYQWYVKDPQFERRAAPTNRLLEQLRRHPPGPLLLVDFPMNPWMARMAAKMVSGWQPDMMRINLPSDSCPDCLQLRWNEATQEFSVKPLPSPGPQDSSAREDARDRPASKRNH